MGELDPDATEIVPYAGKDLVDLGGGLFREGGGEIGASDAMLRQERAELAHKSAGEIRGAAAVHELGRAQGARHKRANGRMVKFDLRLGHGRGF